jgi:hypothetical protein
VERACETIAGQLEPGRNETLNDEAYSLGRLMAGLLEMEGTQAVAEEWDDDTVTGLLIDAAMDAGLPFGEAEGTTWSDTPWL